MLSQPKKQTTFKSSALACNEALISFSQPAISEGLLSEEHSLASVLPFKAVFGDITCDQAYKNAFDFFLASTNEKSNATQFICEHILPTLQTKQRFLDVGVGDGVLSTQIGQAFEQIHLVDLNKPILERLQQQLPQDVSFTHASLEDVVFEPNHYDLCLMSHVLYYVPRPRWVEMITKARRALRENGQIIIVLGGDSTQKNDMLEYFGEKPIDLSGFISECSEAFGQDTVDVYSTRDCVETTNREHMGYIVDFFLNDVKCKVPRKEAMAYIKTHFRQPNGRYKIETEQKYIVIRANV